MVWDVVRSKFNPRWHDHRLVKKKNHWEIKPLDLVTRRQWKAFPRISGTLVDLPVYNIRLVQTRTEGCFTRKECITRVQDVQEAYMRKQMDDIQYNFLVGGNGSIFEGRGWKANAYRADEKFRSIDQDCYDIAYIGMFNRYGTNIPSCMKNAVQEIIRYGIENDYIDCCYRHIPFRNYET